MMGYLRGESAQNLLFPSPLAGEGARNLLFPSPLAERVPEIFFSPLPLRERVPGGRVRGCNIIITSFALSYTPHRRYAAASPARGEAIHKSCISKDFGYIPEYFKRSRV